MGLVARSMGNLQVDTYSGERRIQYAYGIERFLDEAKTLARFSEHPNIVTIRDYFPENNTAYMVMNYIEGQTLEDYLKIVGGKLPDDRMFEIMMPVMDALREIHQTGIMHRDISPDNIFIRIDGRVVLIDFGAARMDLQSKSRSLSVIMKVGYSPEEQYRSQGVQGPWTDIYAVGATLYRGITGQVPPESMDRLAEDTLQSPSVLGISIEPAREAALLKALNVRARDRFQTVEQFQEELFVFNSVTAVLEEHPIDKSEKILPSVAKVKENRPKIIVEKQKIAKPKVTQAGNSNLIKIAYIGMFICLFLFGVYFLFNNSGSNDYLDEGIDATDNNSDNKADYTLPSTIIDDNDILIGSILPLTGAISIYGNTCKEAIDLAVAQTNAAGGVLGKEVQIVYMDNKSAGPESALAAEKLIGTGIIGILGPVAASNSLAAGPLAQDAGIPLISPTSTNPAVTEIGDYIFRASFIDPFQGYVGASFALTDLEAKTAAVLFDTGSSYSRVIYEAFEKAFTSSGGEIVYVGEFVESDQDFSAILTLVKAENPDVVYVPSYYESAGSILRQAAELNIDAHFIGTDGWDAPGLFDIASDAANGSFFTNHYSPDASTPELDAFLASYAEVYGGKIPDAFAALAFDAAMLMFDAIERAGVAEPSAIRDALAATDDFVGVSGTITYDEKRNPVKSAVIIEIVDQAQVFRTIVNPK